MWSSYCFSSLYGDKEFAKSKENWLFRQVKKMWTAKNQLMYWNRQNFLLFGKNLRYEL